MYNTVPVVDVISEIDHIEIGVSDAKEMGKFLEALGYELRRTTDHHGKSYEYAPVDGEGPFFEVFTVSGEDTPGINHVAFATEDIEGVAEELELSDIDVDGPRSVEETGRSIANFRDPDGNRFQVVDDQEG